MVTSTVARPRRFSDDELAFARTRVDVAFVAAGLSNAGAACCPECRTSRKGKVKLFGDGGWKCHRCGAYGDAIGVLVEHASLSFPEAVETLLGRAAARTVEAADLGDEVEISESFEATLDCELYEFVLERCDTKRAQRFFAQWHIDPAVTASASARYLPDHDRLRSELLERFGEQRCVAAGIATVTERGVRLLVNANYPVIEPHISPLGRVCGLQFRASAHQADRVAAHKRGEGPYVPKFLSLKGAGHEHLLGCGLDVLNSLDRGERVLIVEGFKDMLAARTMGANAYAVPGAGVLPPERAARYLKRFELVVCLDGDDAGAAASTAMVEYLRGFGADPSVKKLPAGLDVTDVLVSRMS